MAKYNPVIIDKIIEKTGLAKPTVYRKISEAERLLGVEGNVAALYVATENRVAVKRISSSEERVAVSRYRNQAEGGRILARDAVTGNSRARPKKNVALPKTINPKQVFLIHGRNIKLNSSINGFLRAIGLQPVEFSSAIHGTIKKLKSGGNPYIGEILDVTFDRVKALIVLFSPDDEVQLRKHLWSKSEKKIEKK